MRRCRWCYGRDVTVTPRRLFNGVISLEVKQPERETNHLSQRRDEFTVACTCMGDRVSDEFRTWRWFAPAAVPSEWTAWCLCCIAQQACRRSCRLYAATLCGVKADRAVGHIRLLLAQLVKICTAYCEIRQFIILHKGPSPEPDNSSPRTTFSFLQHLLR